MNEFGQRGVPFSEADGIFYILRDEISSAHNNGMPTDQLVDQVLWERKWETGTQENFSNLAPASSEIVSLDVIVAKQLGVQIELAGYPISENALCISENSSFALDDFVCGYLYGYSSGMVKKTFTGLDESGKQSVISQVFNNLFGLTGFDIYSQSLENQSSELFLRASSLGENEAEAQFKKTSADNAGEERNHSVVTAAIFP